MGYGSFAKLETVVWARCGLLREEYQAIRSVR